MLFRSQDRLGVGNLDDNVLSTNGESDGLVEDGSRRALNSHSTDLTAILDHIGHGDLVALNELFFQGNGGRSTTSSSLGNDSTIDHDGGIFVKVLNLQGVVGNGLDGHILGDGLAVNGRGDLHDIDTRIGVESPTGIRRITLALIDLGAISGQSPISLDGSGASSNIGELVHGRAIRNDIGILDSIGNGVISGNSSAVDLDVSDGSDLLHDVLASRDVDVQSLEGIAVLLVDDGEGLARGDLVLVQDAGERAAGDLQIGRASCRERV